MEIKKVLFALGMTLLIAGTSSLWAQVPPAFETPPLITETEARRFIDEYIDRYTKMEIDPFLALFSRRAIENRMLTYPDIRQVYQGTFDNSDYLKYRLQILSVRIYEDGAAVEGRYEVTQGIKGNPFKKVYSGNIQWYLVREEGVLKVKELNYGRDYRWDRPSHPYP